ncbi:MAG TPA: phosphate-starvation-inducible PsiE family protein, partial [Thermodesulfovibrionales bacterium]|nr:phosphate-starvation-inducible PsiE family protein [Thermodesulfovibrionales bacterium]
SRAVNILRNACIGVLNANFEDPEERTGMLVSLDKLLDMNLDVIMSSYIEEELRTYSGAYRVKNALINFAQGFSQTMNLVLILSLMGLTIGVIVLFVSDIGKFLTGQPEHGIVTALGSLIFLWVMIELMNTEIAHLKGGKFYISVFIGVALVAFIRETLIMTLGHESTEKQYYLIALILVLGIVFWLVTRAERTLKD